MSIGESYLRSVQYSPTHNLLYGDPLTRTFAYLPDVSVNSWFTGTQTHGVITITPSASTSKPGAAIASYALLVDGVRMGSAIFGNVFSLDTRLLADGWHDLRVLAYDNTPVRSVGRWLGTLLTSNYGRAATLSVLPSSGQIYQPAGNLAQNYTFTYTTTGSEIKEVRLIQNRRVIAAASGNASGTLIVYGQNIGAGISRVELEAEFADNRTALSAPVWMNVLSGGSPAGALPVAYSYSKSVPTATAYLVELPASFDAAPGSATYTLLNSPANAAILQSGFSGSGPYRIIQPLAGATGSEQLRFQVTTPSGASNIGAVTLSYSP